MWQIFARNIVRGSLPDGHFITENFNSAIFKTFHRSQGPGVFQKSTFFQKVTVNTHQINPG